MALRRFEETGFRENAALQTPEDESAKKDPLPVPHATAAPCGRSCAEHGPGGVAGMRS